MEANAQPEDQAKPVTAPDGVIPEFMPRDIGPNISLTDDDKERFFRAFMSDSPYTHDYSLFGGRLKLTLQSMTNAQNSSFHQQMLKDKDARIAASTDDYATRISCYRLVRMLKAIDGDENWGMAVADGQNEEDARMNRILSWSTFKLASVTSCLEEFDYRCIKLTVKAQDPDFWKAAGSIS